MLAARHGSTVARISFVAVVVVCSFLLTARYKLSLPDDHPFGDPVTIGHQAWQLAFKAGSKSTASSAELGTEAGTTGNSTGDLDEYLEGWDSQDELWGVPSSDMWSQFSAETTPLTEITVKSCVLPPGMGFDVCAPTSSKKEDATRGAWKRVERDLNKNVGVLYLYVFYRRLLPGSNADVITNLTVLTRSPTDDDLSTDGKWIEVSESLRTGVWPTLSPAYLHYRLTPQADVIAARKMSSNGDAGRLEPINELDIVYGGEDVKPLPGFEKAVGYITGGDDDNKKSTNDGKGTRPGSAIAYRKQLVDKPRTPNLRFKAQGNFTIMQVADLHMSVGPGSCRDVPRSKKNECQQMGADRYSLRWLAEALDEVKPDLVVLTGDQNNGQSTSWSSQSAIMKWAPMIYERGIPWTTIFGNHDQEKTDLGGKSQIELMQHLPLYVGEDGPSNVDGHGNYMRSIRANDSDTVLTTLYFLDSHANSKDYLGFAKGYDHLKANQINWFRGRSSQVKTIPRPYSPKGHGRPEYDDVDELGSDDTVNNDVDRTNRGRRSRSLRTTRSTRGRRRRRQLEEVQTDMDGDAALDRLQNELGALDGQQDQDSGAEIGIGDTMMPSDGSQIKNDDDAEVEYQTDEQAEEAANGGLEDEGDIDEEDEIVPEGDDAIIEDVEYDKSPTKLPVGPTKSKPLVAKPNALMFFHIPLQEAYKSPIDVGKDGSRLLIGNRYEGAGHPKKNSGFFKQGVIAQKEQVSLEENGPADGWWDGESGPVTFGRPEVKVIANGHCHISEDCRRVEGTWMCFGGGGSYSGYGKPGGGFKRRFRVFSLADYGETIETYHLLDDMTITDRVVLVGENAIGE
ncbi:Phosphatase dcr2 [Microbotryomycetes sp. JL221]|nr:Phosphatase dcr2 [Microbotryomycetes sp. JL221]